jgi:hypothetical protein
MMIYYLVGIEILKQKYAFKSFNRNYITLDTVLPSNNVSLNRFNNAVATTVEDKGQSKQVHIALAHEHSQRSPVSFKKYILMPLMFFVVLLAIWVAPTVNRIHAFINPNFVSFHLYLAVGSMGSLRGFWNGVVFVILGWKERKRQKKLKGIYPQ